jgi:Cytochrome C oxidase, cbb3-type, subunit III
LTRSGTAGYPGRAVCPRRQEPAWDGDEVGWPARDGCHGPAGDGNGTIALKFSVPAINIGAPSVQAQTDGELFWKSSNGKGAMPAWKSLLSDEDRWRLVAFVRTFRSR